MRAWRRVRAWRQFREQPFQLPAKLLETVAIERLHDVIEGAFGEKRLLGLFEWQRCDHNHRQSRIFLFYSAKEGQRIEVGRSRHDQVQSDQVGLAERGQRLHQRQGMHAVFGLGHDPEVELLEIMFEQVTN